MNRSPVLLKRIAILAAFIYFAGMAVPSFIPQAQALYWEDDYAGNDPKERIQRNGGFFLFNWIGKLVKKSKRNQYGKIENRDNGPSVNGGRRALVAVTSGVVGLGVGLLIADSSTDNEGDRTANMFLGGALGLGAGVLVAALIMPRDYQVDPVAQAENLRFQQAWLHDESIRTVRAAFHPSAKILTAQF